MSKKLSHDELVTLLLQTHPSPDLLWKQYELHVDLYKHYLELSLKFNLFYYAVTGGILSFYFSNTSDFGVPRYLLLVFPVLLSLGFGAFFIYAASLVKVTREEIKALGKALGFLTFPEIRVLAIILRLSGIMFIVVALCMVAFIWRATNPQPVKRHNAELQAPNSIRRQIGSGQAHNARVGYKPTKA